MFSRRSCINNSTFPPSPLYKKKTVLQKELIHITARTPLRLPVDVEEQRVLLVEDCEVTRTASDLVFRQLGLCIDTASTGEAAVARLEAAMMHMQHGQRWGASAKAASVATGELESAMASVKAGLDKVHAGADEEARDRHLFHFHGVANKNLRL